MNRSPLVSVLISNQNGTMWLPKCIETLRQQTIADRMEIVVSDNASTDESVAMARKLLEGFPGGIVIENGKDLGFTGGNNSAAKASSGKYLFITNNDVWLEPDCLEKLVAGTEAVKANGSTPLVLNYGDDSYQDLGFFGFDPFGLPSPSHQVAETREVFIPGGCAYLIERELYNKIGGFDEALYMYAEEVDLSWRLWVAGGRTVAVPASRIHHRGAAGVNPAGGAQATEFRTNDQKRFLTNRNTLLTVLKSGHSLLLLLVPIQIAFLILESAACVILLKRLSYFRKAFLEALADCWRMRKHICAERKRIAGFRQRGDLWMLRFFRLMPNRWFEVKRIAAAWRAESG